MAKRDPLETLRQMREFAVEARNLAKRGDRASLFGNERLSGSVKGIRVRVGIKCALKC